MTVEEIFANLATHMKKGLMMHDQLATIFGFLNLSGYQKCHEYHYFEETYNYRCLQNFYLENYCKMILPQEQENWEVIPSNWLKHIKQDVDSNTKRAAIKDMTKIWVDWEKETKALLQNDYKELEEQGEIYAAFKIADFLKDVSNELRIAQEKQINLETFGYDITSIIEEQQFLYNKYKKMMKKIYEDDD